MSTASGDEATTAPEAADSVSVVSASEKAPDDESSKQSTAAEEEVVKAPVPEETPSPEKSEPREDDNEEDHHEEDGETLEENEDGDLSEDRSSIAGSSAGSQVPETEREEGDGQEVEDADKKDKKLDHDEDRRDPQYIPKRGVFYEHDDRTLEEDSDVKKEPPREPRRSKAEHIERWGHDMYNEDEQSPKTTQELVDIYGYDIRKEEGPPKARRRRRYGKGPNKYQRSWEDEQAYNKTPTRGGYRGGQKRPPRNFVNRDEDFPTLSGTEPVVGHKEDPDSPRPPHRDHEPKLPSKQPEENRLTKEEIKANHHSLPKKVDPFKGGLPVRGRGISRRGRSSESVQPFTKSQAHGPNHVPDKHPKSGSTADEDIATLAQHFSNAVINVDKNIAPIRSQSEPPAEDRPRHSGDRPHRHEGHKHQDKLHGPPSQEKQAAPLDQPSTKSKRYSTQRQRPTSGSQVPPTSAPPPPPTAQQMPNAPNYLPPQQGYYPPPQHGICPPETTPHIAAPPAQFQPGVQMVTFLPTVPPPPTNTFQPPPNIYVPPTPYIPPPPIVQPGPAEVYQGGVTYYSTQSQPVARAPPSRRVKLAIPIVAPDSSQPIQ